MPNEKVTQFAARFRSPKDLKRQSNPNLKEMTAALDGLRAMGQEGVTGLVDLLKPDAEGGDVHVRHCLHGQAMRAGGWPEKDRQAFTKALAGTLKGDHPKTAKAFVIRQLQVAGGSEVTAALGEWLLDDELWEDAAQALLAIGDTAEQFLKALPNAKGKQLLTIVQALGVMKVNNAAERIRELVTADDAALRQVAARALADMADAGAVGPLLKAADTAKGFDRTKQTGACLQLAENLLVLGGKKKANRIYKHLRDTRKDSAEAYIREAAEHALK
ncbi:MAG: hypothetical protein MK236_03830, partial [Pedosphaera sp.]|nr:hypothetical protein [Pedosphaera sp.]